MTKRSSALRVFHKGISVARNNKLLYLVPIFLLILGDVMFFTLSSDYRIFGILIIYIFLIRLLKLTSHTTFIFSFFLFLFTYIQFIFAKPVVFHQPEVPAVEKTAVWLYLFLLIGVIQKWRE